MSDIGNHVKETLRTANQAFEAGAKAAGDDNTRKLRRLIGRIEDVANRMEYPSVTENAALLAALRAELRDAIAEARS